MNDSGRQLESVPSRGNIMNMHAGIYIRVSSQEQVDEGHSIPAQKKILTEHAKSKGWSYELYSDEGISGETITQRPQMQRLLSDIEAQKIGVVLVIEFERVSRNRRDYNYITDLMREKRVKFATPNQILDLDEPDHVLQMDIRGSFSAFEKANMIKRMKRGTAEAVKSGVYIGSHSILGFRYDKTKKTIEKVPEEAEVIKTIFRLSNQEGLGTTYVARHLNSQGIPRPSVFVKKRDPYKKLKLPAIGDWDGGQVYRIFKNQIYAGVHIYSVKDNNGNVEQITQKVPAIISMEDYELAQENFKTRIKWNNRNIKEKYLLKGLLICGVCGSRMCGATCKAYMKLDENGEVLKDKRGCQRRRWRTNQYYKCAKRKTKGCSSKWIRLEKIEDFVWNWVVSVVKSPQALLDAEIKAQKSDNDLKERTFPEELKVKNDEMRRIDEAYDRLLDAYTMGYIKVETPEDILLVLADRLKWENNFESAPLVEQPIVPEGGQADFSGTGSPLRAGCLSPLNNNQPVPLVPGEERGVIEELLKEEGPLAQDEILEFTGLEPAKLPAPLLQLELAKKVRRTQDGRYALSC